MPLLKAQCTFPLFFTNLYYTTSSNLYTVLLEGFL
nr:MAG TPA: hypothetical protein [Caudoviricetes sp.]